MQVIDVSDETAPNELTNVQWGVADSVSGSARDIVVSGEIGDMVEICIEHGRTMLLWNHPHSVDLLIFFAPLFCCYSFS